MIKPPSAKIVCVPFTIIGVPRRSSCAVAVLTRTLELPAVVSILVTSSAASPDRLKNVGMLFVSSSVSHFVD